MTCIPGYLLHCISSCLPSCPAVQLFAHLIFQLSSLFFFQLLLEAFTLKGNFKLLKLTMREFIKECYT